MEHNLSRRSIFVTAMTEYEAVSIIISLLTMFIALLGVIYMSLQLKRSKDILKANHDWNRRIAAQNSLKEYNQSIIASNLQSEFNYLNRSESIPLQDVLNTFESRPELQIELHQMLNFYESLARGVFHNIYDEKVIKDARKGAMMRALQAFGAYIDYRRKNISPRAWVDVEALITKWAHEDTQVASRSPTDAIDRL